MFTKSFLQNQKWNRYSSFHSRLMLHPLGSFSAAPAVSPNPIRNPSAVTSIDFISWNDQNDGFQSFYPSSDLRNQFSDRRAVINTPRSITAICKYNEVEQHHIAIYAQLRKYGMCLIDNAPFTEGYDSLTGNPPIVDLGNTLGSVRRSNNGLLFTHNLQTNLWSESQWKFTDDPYRDPVPSVQMMHCIEAIIPTTKSTKMKMCGSTTCSSTKCSSIKSKGNVIIDRLVAANVMKQRYPEEFELLSSIRRLFTYYDLNSGRLFTKYQYVIEVDENGIVERVHFNNRTRSGHHHNIERGPNEDYDIAWKRFGEMLCHPDYQYAMECRIEPGQMILFDDNRMLFGRKEMNGLDITALQGCHVDFDSLWAQNL